MAAHTILITLQKVNQGFQAEVSPKNTSDLECLKEIAVKFGNAARD